MVSLAAVLEELATQLELDANPGLLPDEDDPIQRRDLISACKRAAERVSNREWEYSMGEDL